MAFTVYGYWVPIPSKHMDVYNGYKCALSSGFCYNLWHQWEQTKCSPKIHFLSAIRKSGTP